MRCRLYHCSIHHLDSAESFLWKLARNGRRCRRWCIGCWLLLLFLAGAARGQFDRTRFAPPLLAVLLQCVVHLPIAVTGYAEQVLSFGKALGRKSDAHTGILSLASLLIEELRRLQIAVSFRNITPVV